MKLREQMMMTVGLSLLCTTQAHGQQAAATAGGEEASQLEEIVVTAQKRSENMQQVPIAITAFSAEKLQERQVFSVGDIAQYTPNLNFSSAGGGSSTTASFYIRGIGQHIAHFTADPAVGVYLDDVYMARSMGANFGLGDIAQIDVLKGPQGTLFGRNTIGGAVAVTTNRPVFDFEGHADLTVGTIDRALGHLTVNTPIVDDRLAARFTLMGNVRDGWGKNLGADGKTYSMGRARIIGGRFQLLWQPTDRFDMLISADGTRQRGNSPPQGLVGYTATPDLPIDPGWLVKGYDSRLFIKPDDDVDTLGGSVTMRYQGEDVTLKSITAYRWQHGVSGQDYGGIPLPYLAQQTDQRQWQLSQELQATGTLLDDRLKYTLGLYYFKESAHNGEFAWVQGMELSIPLDVTAENFGAYGQLTYNVDDRLSLTGGVRWTYERKTEDVTTIMGGAVLVPQTRVRFSYQPVTPMANIKYQWSPRFMTYASFSKGFRSGAINALPFSATDLIPTRPEKSTAYEAGMKLDAFDRRLRVNAAAFYTDYSDIQIGATNQVDGVYVYRNANAARAKIYGGEIEVTAVPAPGVELFVNGSWLHSEISPVAGFTFGDTALPNAPRFIVDTGLKYAHELASGGRITLGGDVNFRTGAYPQFNPDKRSWQPRYALVNARIAFEPAGQPWTVSLWGKNLTDKRYNVFGQTAGAADLSVVWFGRPLEAGATFAVKF
ncbi:TonB-dependent receptor [Sphingomonas colocasiae]|uniref:TonB-dependent receptor n=1 Tax=Sphingomonas colocasiae TaxID=1848973 RepID=A0ABS7PWC2_9SPHN|nr:TonB-dependent receptor [Sphingomonas colocasiae]MBY8824940.1 TonB-dependent receptor [Sphingomonas colocasiae]